MGIDIGTSGVRAAIFDRKGLQLSLDHVEYPMLCTENDMAELDPEVVLNSLVSVVRRSIEIAGIRSDELEGIGLSTQLFSFMALDAAGEKLTNVITWADLRSNPQAEDIGGKYDCLQLYNFTGCRVQHPMYPLSKILWLKEKHPDIFAKAAKFVSVKEYILFKLFGELFIDITDASTTACFNIHSFRWDDTILKEVIGVGSDRFGQPVECTRILKGMKPEYAGAMGILCETPVIIGSGDGMLANYGCGVVDDISMSCTIGTSGALRIAVDTPLLDSRQRTWCYCFTKDTWVAGGAINNGGIVLKWLRDEYRKQYEFEADAAGVASIYELFDRYAAEIRPGCDGLVFLPFLTGERSPNWNANARGTLHGLRLMHGRKHFIRAAMEGVMYRMFSVFEAIESMDRKPARIIANGGYVKSDLWLQMQADIFNREIAVAGVPEAAVFGAACIAMVSTGALESFGSRLECMQPQKLIKPDEGNNSAYRECYKQYKEIYGKIY